MTASIPLLLTLLLAPPADAPEVEPPEPPAGLVVVPPEERDPAKASERTQAGNQAYKASDYASALVYYEEAYKYSADPLLLYDMGRVFQRMYELDRTEKNLQAAISRYNDALRLIPTEGEFEVQIRKDATDAIAELQASREKKVSTILMLESTAEGALISVDGGDPKPPPTVAEVDPDVDHTVVVTAEGYYDETRVVSALEGERKTVSIPLREKEASLTIRGPRGAELYLDGLALGKLPDAKPEALAPGIYDVAVQKNGRVADTFEVELDRGEERVEEVELKMSDQRKAGWALLGVGGAGLITGGALAGVALAAQADMLAIDEKRENESVTDTEWDEKFGPAQSRRNTYRTAAAVALSVGAAVATTSIFVIAFDRTTIDGSTQYRRERRRPDDGGTTPGVELGLAPGLRGGQAVVRGRF